MTLDSDNRPALVHSDARPSWLARLGLLLVLLFCAVLSWRPLGGGFDFWAHATVGRWMSDHASIPTHSLFLWSSPGFPWVYHSWLSQIAFYELVHLFGPVGVMVFNTLLVCAVFALLWRLWRKRAGVMPFYAPLVFFVAIFLSAPRFQPRQELFTALLLVVFFGWMLRSHEDRLWDERDARPIPLFKASSLWFIALFVLWINLHALVLFPLVLLWAAVVTDAVQFRFDRRARSLLVIAFLCSAATLCNPWGSGYWAAANVLKPGSQATKVQEWWPVWVQWPDMSTSVFGNSFLMVVAILGWAANQRRRWAELLWLLGTAALFARSRRLMWIMAIVCLAVIASNAASYSTGLLWSRWRTRSKQPAGQPPLMMRWLSHGVVWFTLLVALVSQTQVFVEQKADFVPLTGVSRFAPRAAADWILRQHAPQRTFTDYEYSSYFHWRFNGADNSVNRISDTGRRPLFADLLNAYPDKILDDYFEILEATPRGLHLINTSGVNTIVLGQPHLRIVKNKKGKITDDADKISYYLDASPAWRRGFHDNNATVWVRRKPVAPVKPPQVRSKSTVLRANVLRTAR